MNNVQHIAELGSNHNRDLARMFRLIEAAKRIGCYMVKVQLFTEDLYADLPQFAETRAEFRKRAMPPEWMPKIRECCNSANIKLQGTPFSLEAVPILAEHCHELKVGSYEILWLDLIGACAKTGLPLTLSFGNVSQGEAGVAVATAVGQFMSGWAEKLWVYHCVGEYPCRPDQCNLPLIRKYRRRWGPLGVGWSDHSRDPGVIVGAVAEGAERIEFHLDLDDGEGWEGTHGHCWTETEAEQMIRLVGSMQASLPRSRDWFGESARRAEMRTDPRDGRRPLMGARGEGAK